MFLRELVLGVTASNAVTADGDVRCLVGEVPTTNRLVLIVEEHLARLGDEARTVLQTLAVGEPLPFDVMAKLFADGAMAQVERAGLVTAVDEAPPGYRLGHPLYGEVLRKSLSRAEERAIKARLVTAMADHGAERTNLDAVCDVGRRNRQPVGSGSR